MKLSVLPSVTTLVILFAGSIVGFLLAIAACAMIALAFFKHDAAQQTPYLWAALFFNGVENAIFAILRRKMAKLQ